MAQNDEQSGFLDRGDQIKLAWRSRPAHRGGAGGGLAAAPCVVFLPGFASDMTGTKAQALDTLAMQNGFAYLRFDYSGHGKSGGRFEDGTITGWTDDALAVINARTRGELILIGSSMGGWIALRAALALRNRVRALIGIAAAPDFTETLLWEAMTFEERRRLQEQGEIEIPNPYGPPTRITRTLIEDGRRCLLLDKGIPLACPVTLLHGQADAEVPWETALKTARAITSGNVQVVLIKDGDHRLSREQDLALLAKILGGLLGMG